MPKKIKFNIKESDKIIKSYQSGLSCKEIGNIFNCSKQTINSFLKSQGITLRDSSHCQIKYDIDENIFEKIDNPEKSYWLGMLTGDGWITDSNDFGLSLEQNDKDLIYKFRDFLKSNHPIVLKNNKIKKDGTNSISAEIRITNKKIVSDLKKYNFCPNKTLGMDFPIIDEKLLCYYMLGLIDSDGSFYLKNHYKKNNVKLLNFNFVGPSKFVEDFQNKLIKKCGISKTKLGLSKVTPFIKTVGYAGYKNIYKIVRFLYEDPPIWMERKRKIALEYLITKYPSDEWIIKKLNQSPGSQVSQTAKGWVDSTIHTEYSESFRSGAQ
jgi:hypothetical protein